MARSQYRIPHDWAESQYDEDGTYQFFEPNGNSGTLQVSLITAQRNEDCTQETLQEEEFENRQEPDAHFFRIGDDGFATEWNEPTEKDNDVHMFYWTVAAVINPKLIRKAVFSYTVRNSRMKELDFSHEIDMVRECVMATYFVRDTVQ